MSTELPADTDYCGKTSKCQDVFLCLRFIPSGKAYLPLISTNVPGPDLCTSSESTVSSSSGICVETCQGQTPSLGVSGTAAAHGTPAGRMCSKPLSPLGPHCPHSVRRPALLRQDPRGHSELPGSYTACFCGNPPATLHSLPGQCPLCPRCHASLGHVPVPSLSRVLLI